MKPSSNPSWGREALRPPSLASLGTICALLVCLPSCTTIGAPQVSGNPTTDPPIPEGTWWFHTDHSLRTLGKAQEPLWRLCDQASYPLPYRANPDGLAACIQALKPPM